MKMPYALREKIFLLRCRSKEGRPLTPEELETCKAALRDYPEDYKALNEEVFQATLPFGASVPRKRRSQ